MYQSVRRGHLRAIFRTPHDFLVLLQLFLCVFSSCRAFEYTSHVNPNGGCGKVVRRRSRNTQIQSNSPEHKVDSLMPGGCPIRTLETRWPPTK